MLRSFFSRIIVIGVLFHVYVGLRLITAMPPDRLGQTVSWVLGVWLVASCTIIPFGFYRRAKPASGWRRWLTWIGLLQMGGFSFTLTLTFIRDIVLMCYALFAGVLSDAALARMSIPTSAAFSTDTAFAVLIGAIGMTAVGIYNARRRAPIARVRVPIANLPVALQGFTFVQLSDIHVGPTIRKRYLDKIVDAVNGLQADAVVITGDIVDGSVEALREHTHSLGRLTGKHGVFLCTGNHEYYAGADAWIAEFRRLGIRVLMNEHDVLEHGGARLVLGGVTDFSASHFGEIHRSDPARAMAGAPPDAALRVLLAHQPRSYPAALAAGFDLQLSGHTHGGQFFPWNFAVRVQQPFTAGLIRTGAMWLYISRGTGYWGPPVRLAAPSEITRIELVPA